MCFNTFTIENSKVLIHPFTVFCRGSLTPHCVWRNKVHSAPSDLTLKHKINWTEGEITWLCPADAASGKMRRLVSERRQSSAAMFTAAMLAFRVCQVCLRARETGQTHLIQHEEKQQKNMMSRQVGLNDLGPLLLSHPRTARVFLYTFSDVLNLFILKSSIIVRFGWLILSRTPRNNQNTKKVRFFRTRALIWRPNG